MMKPLVVVGSINADIVLRIPRLPQPGETLAAKAMEQFPGGKGANQAAAAAKLSHETVMIGQVGTDSNADFMLGHLQAAGVDCTPIQRVDGPTGTAVILLQVDGENSIVIVGGANTAPWQLGQRQRDVIAAAGMVLLQREIPHHVNAQVAQLCRDAAVPVILDAGGADEPLPAEFLQNIDTLSPNETELARLSGEQTASREQVLRAAAALMGRDGRAGPARVLVKRGAQGSLLIERAPAASSYEGVQVIAEQPAIPADRIVDTTGAGDCFTAAYAVALLKGKAPKEAMQFAAGAASICIQRIGAMTSMPSEAEVLELLQQS